MIKAGSMDRRITINTKGVTLDSSGSEIATYTTVATVWADVNDNREKETTEGKQVTASEFTTFTVRYRTDVTPIDQIVYESKTYDIKGISEIGRREGLAIDAVYKDNK